MGRGLIIFTGRTRESWTTATDQHTAAAGMQFTQSGIDLEASGGGSEMRRKDKGAIRERGGAI